MTRFRRTHLRPVLFVCSLLFIMSIYTPLIYETKPPRSITSVINGNLKVTLPEVEQREVNIIGKPEVRHVVFLKVHKAASSTIMNIFIRFGLSRDLNIMLPKHDNVFSQAYSLEPSRFINYSSSGVYDILCCHVIYKKSAIAPYFPSDTRYIGVVRHPFSQFISAFQYYRQVHRLDYLVQIPGHNPISTYLNNPRRYEPEHALMSYTNNRMAFDFGYIYEQFTNISHQNVYMNQLKSELDFVIIVEYFDESLVMLKRQLGWTLKDILYIPRKNGREHETLTFNQTDVDRHAQWANLDYILYETFLNIFLKKLNQQDRFYFDELNTFRSIRYQVEEFCVRSEEMDFQVDETVWNNVLTLTREDCDLMLKKSRSLIKVVKKRYVTPEYGLQQ